MKGIMIVFNILMLIIQILMYTKTFIDTFTIGIEKFKNARNTMKIQVIVIFISWAYVIIKFAVNLF